MSVSSCLSDIIILTETNLTPSISTGELGFANYDVFRRDRDGQTSSKTSGGGVLVAVSKNFQSYQLSPQSETESIFLCLPLNDGSKALLVGSYLPPGQPAEIYLNFVSCIEDVMASQVFRQVFLLGDYNLPDIDWTSSPPNATSAAANVILGMSEMFQLRQVNDIRNLRGAILDLIFSSAPDSIPKMFITRPWNAQLRCLLK